MLASEKETARFERGFKTWAENTAIAIRSRLELCAIDPLDYSRLAKHLGVVVWNLADISELPESSLRYLTSSEGDDWSAVTVSAEKTVIVLNSCHSIARQSSSAMHELAHLLRGHEPAQVNITSGGLTFRSYDPRQEAEADWLSGCLILPRTVLEHCAQNKISESEACKTYVASSALYKYRLRITGVSKQFARRMH